MGRSANLMLGGTLRWTDGPLGSYAGVPLAPGAPKKLLAVPREFEQFCTLVGLHWNSLRSCREFADGVWVDMCRCSPGTWKPPKAPVL